MTCAGRTVISDMNKSKIVINQQLHASILSKLILPKFLKYHIEFLHNYLNKMANATTISYLNKTNCHSIPINLPPVEERD
jgi:restriction endonuclease S subunit